MSMQAKMIADFAQFDYSCKQSVSELDKLMGKASTVGQSLDKMTASFSGAKVIQDANLMTEAVFRIGGASTLTAAEQAKVNRVVTEAIAKYAALGQTAPPAMIALAEATKRVEPPTRKAFDATKLLEGALGALGVSLSIGTITAYAGELLRLGDQIQKVADRTGLTTAEVQKLQYAAGQSGNTIDDLTTADGQMQNRMDDPAFETALRKIGVNFAQLRSANVYEQLQLISAGFQNVSDPALKAQIAMDLFGKAGIGALPTIKANMRELGEEAPVMSDRTIKSLDDIGDAWTRAKGQIAVGIADPFIKPYQESADEGRS
jgi:hypothetical protein